MGTHAVPTTDAGTLSLALPGDYRPLRRTLLAAAAVVVVCLAGTAGFIQYLRSWDGHWSAAGRLKYVLIQLHLGEENVPAAWVASMLLLAVGVTAGLCFLVDGPQLQRAPAWRRLLRFGWIAMAGGFALLSLDELGSVHERIGASGVMDSLPLSQFDIVLLPMALAGLFMAAFMLLHLIRRPIVLGLLVLGGILLVAVPVLEHVEAGLFPGHRGGDLLKRSMLWTLAEEGLELGASLAFLAATLTYLVQSVRAINTANQVERTASLRLELDREHAILWLLPVMALFGIGYYLSDLLLMYWPTGDKGIPHNWFTAAPAAGAAALAVALGLRRDCAHRGLYLGLGVLCALLSVYHGSSMTYWLAQLTKDGRVRPLVEGAMALGLLLAGIGLVRLTQSPWCRLGLIAGVGMAIYSLLEPGPNADLVETITFWTLIPALMGYEASHRRTGPATADAMPELARQRLWT